MPRVLRAGMVALKTDKHAEFWAVIDARWNKAGLRAWVRHLRGGDKLLRHATLQCLDLRIDRSAPTNATAR